ncbi:MAG: lipoyl synthase [Dehalococcoidia bacterium]|nr:lipoyl synthase [Dehalococcoidia bacterium]
MPGRPDWLGAPAPAGGNYRELKALVDRLKLHTVCESAACPNVGECWNHRTATFMILGNVCTWACRYCAVETGTPHGLDLGEPVRVAETVARLGLSHVVITSVTRDDLPDGGAWAFAACIEQIRNRRPQCSVEVLIPDFKGDEAALATVMAARPEILNHNTETVPRLYRTVRPQAVYERSLRVLRRAKELDPGALTKSGLMVGLGETREELLAVFRELAANGVDILTVGQYLQPTPAHLPIVRYYEPREFEELKAEALAMGFRHVEAGPLVRSSYHAEEQAVAARDAGADAGMIPLTVRRADAPA